MQDELPATEFSMWIRPLQAELSDNTLALYAPNRFVLDWVRDKYLNNINGLLNDFAVRTPRSCVLRWALSPPARCRKGGKPGCGGHSGGAGADARARRRSCAPAGIMSRRRRSRPKR
ncbi:hypothetical protein J4733_23480 [Klebsiella pneumoniae]|uniref:DnaA N-terminal domain-containing protein n=1 Tax=Klebsiella pneumoniae TaxID=573 RepID=A0A939NP19_KLEPN|nr:hypothetical protein [Klebsiella pneumoniae]